MDTCATIIKYLFISAGHNFFGHHQQPAGTHPTIEVEEIICVAGRGIRGDRFFDHQENYKGQITFFAWEVFQSLSQELQLSKAIPALCRRNVLLAGVNLAAFIGTDFSLQGIRFAGVEECRPCHWMNQAFGHPGVEQWLQGRGGLRARILTDGVLRRGIAA
jgi:MOSC domain-containing protein YiiM